MELIYTGQALFHRALGFPDMIRELWVHLGVDKVI
jgi:hypothetical protein